MPYLSDTNILLRLLEPGTLLSQILVTSASEDADGE
jgi:hypothetical protein